MNWRLSALDGYTLVSNSDAHSPAKLGREANLINAELSYAGLKRAIEGGADAALAVRLSFFRRRESTTSMGTGIVTYV